MRICEVFDRQFETVDDDMALGEVLAQFKKGRGHLAVVRGIQEYDDGRDSTYVVRGIITLEDIVEAILGDEIVDETDEFVHTELKDRVVRPLFSWLGVV